MTELPIDDATLDEWLTDTKRDRIRSQSKQVASYIASNEAFYNWFSEIEGYHVREERFWDDCDRRDSKALFDWIRVAFHLGYLAGQKHD